MAKVKKAKTQTFRQRLRADAERKLDVILGDLVVTVKGRLKGITEVQPSQFIRLLGSSQVKTLRSQLIGELANELERELEEIYNKQMALLPEVDIVRPTKEGAK